MYSQRNVSIDLLRPIYPVLYTKQGDTNSRKLKILFFEGAVEWEIPTGLHYIVQYSKPDGTFGIYEYLPDGSLACVLTEDAPNEMIVTFAPQMLTVSGTVKFSVKITDESGSTLQTFSFRLEVEKSEGYEASSENYYSIPTFEAVWGAIGDLDDLKTKEKNSIVGAINEAVSGIVVVARAADGHSYDANVEGMEISIGTEIVLIPQSTNQGEATLAINGGEAYALTYRPGYLAGGTPLRPTLRLPVEAEMLLRGGEYVFRFDGIAWVLQSYVDRPASDYVDVTESFRADDDYRDHPEEYLRSLGPGKWLINDGEALYRMEIFALDGQEWRNEQSWTDDGIYTLRMFNAGREIVNFDTGNEELTVNGSVIAPSGDKPSSGVTLYFAAQAEAPSGVPNGAFWLDTDEDEPESSDAPKFVTDPEEAQDGDYWLDPSEDYVLRSEMESYVASAISAALAAIPNGEEMLFG